MSEMKTLTLNGKTYDSFVDKEAREALENLEPGGVTDEQIASAVEDYFAENPVQGDGWPTSAKNLLITILRNGVYSTDQSANITALENAIAGNGEEPDVPVEPDEPPHTHSYTSSVTTAATCETAGVRTYSCTCGHRYTEVIPATGHSYVDGVCENCGADDPDYVPAENNGWVDGEAYAIEWTDGYKIDNTSANETFGDAIESSDSSVSGFLPCYGASALMLGAGVYPNYGVYFYDENKTLMQRSASNLSYPSPVPLNAYYCRVQCVTTKKATATVTPVKFAVLGETTVWEAGEYYNLSYPIVGDLNRNTGVVTENANSNYVISDYAFCYGATTIQFMTYMSTYRTTLCFYDDAKNYISGSTVSGSEWTVPEGAKYFRLGTYNGDQYNNGQGMNNPWLVLA